MDVFSWFQGSEIGLVRLELYSVVIETLHRNLGVRGAISLNSDFQITRNGAASEFSVVSHNGDIYSLWSIVGKEINELSYDDTRFSVEIDDGASIQVYIKKGTIENVNFSVDKDSIFDSIP